MTALPPYPSARRGFYAVAVLLLALTISFVDRQLLSLLVQPVRADLGLNDTHVSLLQGIAFALFYTVLGVPLGRWADRHSRQRMIVIGMILWCLATAACGLARNFSELFAARILVGVGEATLSPAAYSMIADLFPPQRRARAMSLFTLGVLLGSGLALLLGGMAIAATAQAGGIALPLVGWLAPWQAAFLIVGLAGLPVAALIPTIGEPSRQDMQSGGQDWPATLRFLRPRMGLLWLISVGFGLGGGTIGFGIGAWLPTTFIRIHGWSAGEIAGAMGVIMLSVGVAGVVAGGWLGDRFRSAGRPTASIDGALLGIVGMLPALPVLGLASNPFLSLTAFAWIFFFLGLPTALAVPSLHAVVVNNYRGLVTALYLFVTNLVGFACGPTLVAIATDLLFHDDRAVGRSLALVTTLAALGGIALLLMARRRYAAFLVHHKETEI